jgi:hypothetical protein
VPLGVTVAVPESVGEGEPLPVLDAGAPGEAVGEGVLLSEPDCVAPPPPEHVVTMTSVEDPCVSASQPVVICMDGSGCAQSRALNGKAVTPPVALHV